MTAFLQIGIFVAAILVLAFPYHCVYERQKSWTERFNNSRITNLRGWRRYWKVSNVNVSKLKKEIQKLQTGPGGGFPVPDEFTKLIHKNVIRGEPMVLVRGEFGLHWEFESEYRKRIRNESPVEFRAADGTVLKTIQYRDFLKMVVRK